jgi:hypothetical protein
MNKPLNYKDSRRPKFEAWMFSVFPGQGLSYDSSTGKYVYYQAQEAWTVWNAAIDDMIDEISSEPHGRFWRDDFAGY